MKLKEITKLSQFMEMLEWDLDENGLQITDWDRLVRTVAYTFDELEWDMEVPEDEDEDEDA